VVPCSTQRYTCDLADPGVAMEVRCSPLIEEFSQPPGFIALAIGSPICCMPYDFGRV